MENRHYDEAEDAKKDMLLDSDYDFFCDYYKEDFEGVRIAVKKLKDLHKIHNWEFDLGDIL